MASTGGSNPTYCEAELVALCSQKTDPIPVCYTLNGVSQTIYAVLKHPHKGAPTVAFMAPDFTSFNATTGGTFGIGVCPVQNLQHNPVWRCNGAAVEEAKAWYDAATGALIRVNTLNGADVTADWTATGFKEAPSPQVKRGVEYGWYASLPVSPQPNGYSAVSGGGVSNGQPVSSLPAPAFGVAYEVRFYVDGAIDQGNGAGAAFGGNWPTTLNSTADFAALLNASALNTAPKDIWAAAPDGETIYITNTAGGSAPFHDWYAIVAYRSPVNGTGDFWLKDNNTFLTQLTPAGTGTGGCRQIEVVKTWAPCAADPTLTGYEVDGTPIAGFDLTLLRSGVATERRGCADVGGQNWNVVEQTDACGNVRYFDPDTSPMVDITAQVGAWYNEGVCTCCTKTPPAVLPPLRFLQAYGGSFVGFGGVNNKFATGAMSWVIKIHKNHVLAYTSPASPILSSAAAAQSWVDAIGGGGYLASSGVWAGGTAPGMMVPDTTDVWTICFEETDSSGANSNWAINQGYGYTNDPAILATGGCAAGQWMCGMLSGQFITDANIAGYATLCLP